MGGTPPAFGEITEAVQRSPLPMLLMTLPDRRIRAVSEPATELFGAERSVMLEWRVGDLLSAEDAKKDVRALSAMSTGAIDSYRAHRSLRTARGSVEAAVWVRLMRAGGNCMAVAIIATDDDAVVSHRSIATFFGPDALDLAIGTLDATGRIERITPNCRLMLGRDQSAFAGESLIHLVHPVDADRLADALLGSEHDRDQGVVGVRMQHAIRGWTEVHCLFLPLPHSDPPRIAFILAGSATVGTEPDADRLAQLQGHLLRIGAVLHEAGLSVDDPFAPDASRFPALNELTARQRLIVDRLLRGERIPAIAAALFVSASTVRNHLAHVFAKFGVHSQEELLSLLRSDLDAPAR